MRTTLIPFFAIPALAVSSCGGGSISTHDVEQAAIDKARQDLRLDAEVPLRATVWTGREADGQPTYCGSVGSAPGAATPIKPQQFAAHGDPLNFFIFGEAHQVTPLSEPGKFENWTALCAREQGA